MNSLPRRRNAGTVSAIASTATSTTVSGCRVTSLTTGAYAATSRRLRGLSFSRRTRPRIASTASAGASVTASTAAKPIE
jgi:hypothetical protein